MSLKPRGRRETSAGSARLRGADGRTGKTLWDEYISYRQGRLDEIEAELSGKAPSAGRGGRRSSANVGPLPRHP